MKNRNFFPMLLKIFYIISILMLCINMTGGGGKQVGLEPEFVELKEGEGSFSGKIYDEQSIIDVKEISFTGHTSIGGVRKETDDSVNILDLAIIKEIEILKPDYESKRFSDKEFTLTAIEYLHDSQRKEFLVPKKIVICAREANTGQKKAWLFSKIKKITIERKPRQIPTTEVEIEQKKNGGIMETIKSGWSKITETINL
ncbi:hypothetical protein GF322_02880 [Candidatus Dependentiae bacterium]|nr:hypothetical protein [Candidatus Dependentiae bacterium]